MRQEVKEFYRSKNLPVGRMVGKGSRRGLPGASIRAAAEEVYDEIQNGMEIEDIRIAWRVYDKANHLTPVLEENEDRRLDEIHAMLSELSMPLWKRFKRAVKGLFNGD